MTTALDFVTGDAGFPMPGATRFVRLRASRNPSPTNPMQTVDDWTYPERLEFTGMLTQSSSTRIPDGLRDQTDTGAYITCNDPTLDIRNKDRIETIPYDGRRWEVNGEPSRDINPFTGTQPTLEIPVETWKG